MCLERKVSHSARWCIDRWERLDKYSNMEILNGNEIKEVKRGKGGRPYSRYYCIKSKAVLGHVQKGYIRMAPRAAGRPSRRTTMKLFKSYFEPRVHLTDIATVFTNINKTLKQASEMPNKKPEERPISQTAEKIPPPSRFMLFEPEEDGFDNQHKRVSEYLDNASAMLNKQQNNGICIQKPGLCDPYEFDDTDRNACDFMTQKKKTHSLLRRPSESRQVESFMKNASIVLKIRTSQDSHYDTYSTHVSSPTNKNNGDGSDMIEAVKTVKKSSGERHPDISTGVKITQTEGCTKSPQFNDCNGEFLSVMEGVSEEQFIDDEDEANLVIDEDTVTDSLEKGREQTKGTTDKQGHFSEHSHNKGSLVKSPEVNHVGKGDERIFKKELVTVAPEDFFPEIVSVTSLSDINSRSNSCGYTIQEPKEVKKKRKRRNKPCHAIENSDNTDAKRKKLQKQSKVDIFHKMKELKKQGSGGQFIEVKPIESESPKATNVMNNGITNFNMRSNFKFYYPNNEQTIYPGNDSQNDNIRLHFVPPMEHPSHFPEPKPRKRRKSSKTSSKNSCVKKQSSEDASSRMSDKTEVLPANQNMSTKEESRVDSPGIAVPERLVRDFVNHNWLMQKYQIDQPIDNPEQPFLSQAVTIGQTQPSIAIEEFTPVYCDPPPHILLPLQQIRPSSQIAALKLHQNTRELVSIAPNVKTNCDMTDQRTQQVGEIVSKPPVKDFQSNTNNPILPKLQSPIQIGATVHYTSTNTPPVIQNGVVRTDGSTNVAPKTSPVKQLNITPDGTQCDSNKSRINDPDISRVCITSSVSNCKMSKASPNDITKVPSTISQQNQTDLLDLSAQKSESITNENVQGISEGDTRQQKNPSEPVESERKVILKQLTKQFEHFEKMYKKLEKLEEIKEKETKDLKSKVQQAALQMDQIHANINRLVEGSSKSIIKTDVTENTSHEQHLEKSKEVIRVDNKTPAKTEATDLTCEVLDLSKKSQSGTLTGDEMTLITRKEEPGVDGSNDFKVTTIDKSIHCTSVSNETKVSSVNLSSPDKGVEYKSGDRFAKIEPSVAETKDDLTAVSRSGSIVSETKVIAMVKLPKLSIDCKDKKLKQECKFESQEDRKKSVEISSANEMTLKFDENVKSPIKETKPATNESSSSDIVQGIIDELIAKSMYQIESQGTICIHKDTNPAENRNDHSHIEEQVQNTLKNIIKPSRLAGRVRGKSRLQRGMNYRYRGPPNVTFGNRAALPFLQEQRHLVPQFPNQHSVNRPIHVPFIPLRLPVHPPSASNIQRQIQPVNPSQNIQQMQPMPNTGLEHHPPIYQQVPQTAVTHLPSQTSPAHGISQSQNNIKRPPNANLLVAGRPLILERPGMVTGAGPLVINQPMQRAPRHLYRPFNPELRFQQNNPAWLQHQQHLPLSDIHGNQFIQSQGTPRMQQQGPFHQSHMYQTQQNTLFSNQPIGNNNANVTVSQQAYQQNNPAYVNNRGNCIILNNNNGIHQTQTTGNGLKVNNIIQNPVKSVNDGAKNNISPHHPPNTTEDIGGAVRKVKSPPVYPGKAAVIPKISVKSATSVPDSEKTGKNQKRTPQCSVCSKKAVFICSGCKKVPYCSHICQNEAWRSHSKDCK